MPAEVECLTTCETRCIGRPGHVLVIHKGVSCVDYELRGNGKHPEIAWGIAVRMQGARWRVFTRPNGSCGIRIFPGTRLLFPELPTP